MTETLLLHGDTIVEGVDRMLTPSYWLAGSAVIIASGHIQTTMRPKEKYLSPK